MDIGQIKALALEAGFTAAGQIDVSKLQFLDEVRDMCAADKCHSYNKSWSCPPAAGALEEIRLKCSGYDKGLLVQTVGMMESEFDFEAMMGIEKKHSHAFRRLTKTLSELGLDMLPMGAGACRLCDECTYPDEPCRFPELVFPSMEACGLFVSQVCKDNGIAYYYGKNSLSFVSCYLFK